MARKKKKPEQRHCCRCDTYADKADFEVEITDPDVIWAIQCPHCGTYEESKKTGLPSFSFYAKSPHKEDDDNPSHTTISVESEDDDGWNCIWLDDENFQKLIDFREKIKEGLKNVRGVPERTYKYIVACTDTVACGQKPPGVDFKDKFKIYADISEVKKDGWLRIYNTRFLLSDPENHQLKYRRLRGVCRECGEKRKIMKIEWKQMRRWRKESS